jgi:hypothetical protein
MNGIDRKRAENSPVAALSCAELSPRWSNSPAICSPTFTGTMSSTAPPPAGSVSFVVRTWVRPTPGSASGSSSMAMR